MWDLCNKYSLRFCYVILIQVRNQPLGDGVASLVPVSLLAKDDSNILDKGSTADTDKTRKQQQFTENTTLQKQAILEEIQVPVPPKSCNNSHCRWSCLFIFHNSCVMSLLVEPRSWAPKCVQCSFSSPFSKFQSSISVLSCFQSYEKVVVKMFPHETLFSYFRSVGCAPSPFYLLYINMQQ